MKCYIIESKGTLVFMTVLLLRGWLEQAVGLHDHYIYPYLFLAGFLSLPAILIYQTLHDKNKYDHYRHIASGQDLMSGTSITSPLITQTIQLSGMHRI
ncbi:hypothetical protein [Edaphocola flava]|uniref:hypothetical protein n=1 Tax=Edaphocola flava TaxID=2499629 RepID=UPI00100BFEF3|nr:hypothetical protein [Edaphocola flava]